MKRLLLLAVVASAMLVIPTTASAAVNCTLAGGTLTVNVTGTGDQAAGIRMTNGGTEVGVYAATDFTSAQVCTNGPPTTSNTNLIAIADTDGGTQRTVVAISQGGGPLTNNVSESPGVNEIEITYNGGDETNDNLQLVGAPAPAGDNWRMGELGGGDEGYQLDDTESAAASDVNDLVATSVEQLQIGLGSNPGDDIIDGRGGAGFTAPLSLTSTVAQFVGGTGDDQLFAGNSNNWRLEGDEGEDVQIGGPGDDFIQLSQGTEADIADGNGGTDNCSYLNHNDGLAVDLRITAPQNTVGAGIDTISDCEVLAGGNGADSLIGTGGANQIFGGPGNDTLMGLGGDDTLNGQADLDTVSYAQGSTGPVTVDIGNPAAQNAGGAGIDTLSNFESLTGSEFSDTLIGDGGSNVIDGHDGVLDTIDCAGGIDGAIVDEVGVDTVTACEAVDNAPKVSVGTPPPDGAVLSDSTPTYSLTADEPASFQLSIDGGSFTACLASCESPALAEGVHTLRFRAVDLDENLNPGLNAVARTVTVDTVAPTVQITDGPTGATEDATPTFSFGASESATFECRVDGDGFGACSGPGGSHTTATLAEGDHTFEVRATDGVGHAATASRSFTVVRPADPQPPTVEPDVTAPETTITKVKVKRDGVKIKFSSNEANSSFQCKLDKGAFRPCSSPAKYKKLDEGKHKFQVVATDAVGNKDGTAAKAKFRV